MSSKVSFTVRRPSPLSREASSGADSDPSGGFKIPAIPRRLNGNGTSTPGSPLSRSAAPSPKRSYADRDSSDEDESQDELVTGFDQFGVQRCVTSWPIPRSGSQLTAVTRYSLHEKKKPEGPLVIPPLKNRDWREHAKRRKTKGMFVPPSARANTVGADGSVGGLGTTDSINSGPEAVGLQIKQKKVEIEVEVEMEDVEDVTPKVEESDEQKAIRALLSSADGQDDTPQIDAIPLTEEDAYRQDLEELPESATLDDYERVPVSQFGAALLRGMGWTEGSGANHDKKGRIQPWTPQSRPALLGIGAKEKEAFDDGSKRKKYGGKPDKKYIPLVKVDRPGDERSSSRKRSPSQSGSGSRRHSRSPSPNRSSSRKHRDSADDRRDTRDRDYDRRRDDYRDKDSRRDKDSGRDRDLGRDKDYDRHRSGDRDRSSSRRDDRDSSRRRDRRD